MSSTVYPERPQCQRGRGGTGCCPDRRLRFQLCHQCGQQAYQQQIGALTAAIPTLYSLALDTYQSGGEELVNRLDQLNGQEQNAQTQYDRQLQDYYTQLQQKGEAYNDAYARTTASIRSI